MIATCTAWVSEFFASMNWWKSCLVAVVFWGGVTVSWGLRFLVYALLAASPDDNETH